MLNCYRSLRIAVCGGLLLVALPGCGNSTPVVHGTITVNGEALSDGSVTFEPVDGASASVGAKISEGNFEVPATSRMTPGMKKVTIRGSIKTGRLVQAAPPAPIGVMVDELTFYPPPGGQPELREVEVREGDNELRFEMTVKKTAKKK